jgi:tripartite motif-containing protein 71
MVTRVKVIIAALLFMLIFPQALIANTGSLYLKAALPSTGYYPILGPGGVALDNSGNFYIADITSNSIVKISAAGVLLTTFGGGGGGSGKFNLPYSVAVDGAGQHVYVADSGNNLIQHFTYDAGSGIYTFDSQCDGTVSSASFYQPRAVAVDGAGNIYVADYGNHRIVELVYDSTSHTYTCPHEWGSGYGSSLGQFAYPEGVAADASGNIYVGDTQNNRLQKYDGSNWTAYGSYGSGDGYFNYPKGVAVDGAGNIYVADNQNYRLQKLSSSGAYVTQWGVYGKSDGQFLDVRGVAVNAAGTIVYAADIGNPRVQSFSGSGSTYSYANQWACSGSGNGQFKNPLAVAADAAGNIYVADANNNRIQKFTYDAATRAYTYYCTWGGPAAGTNAGQFWSPCGVALDAAGNIFVSDTANNRIQKYNVNSSSWSIFSTGYTIGGATYHWSSPRGIALDAAGNLFVVDNGHYRVEKLDASGTWLASFGWGPSQGDGRFSYPVGLALDRAGNVYVADSNNQCIQKFSPNGAGGYSFATSWGFMNNTYGWGGSGDGFVNNPQGVAVDRAGFVYVADYSNRRVQKFTTAGKFRGAFASFTPGDGSFYGPYGIGGANGNIYVTDSTASRVYVFSAPSPMPQILLPLLLQ